MGIDNVHQKYISDAVQANLAAQPAHEQEEQAVITGSAAPVGDSVQIKREVPEWADIEKSDGKIGDFKQGTTGDCWLLATLIALKLAGAEEKFLTSRIKKKDGKLQVSFGSQKEQKVFSFSQQEIKDRMLHPEEEIIDYTVAQGGEFLRDIIKKHNSKRLEMESIKRLRELNVLTDADIPKAQGGKHLRIPHIFGKLSSGDIDVVAFEMAQEKFIGKEMDGEYPSFAMKNLTGRPVTSINLSDGAAKTGHELASKDEAKTSWGLFGYVLRNKPNVAAIACTGRNVDKNSGLVGPHAYTVDLANSSVDQIVLINPHDTKQRKTMTRQDFKKHFSYIVFAELNNYQTYTVKEGDNISKIASENRVKPQDLMLANPTLKSVDSLKINQKLNIPIIK